MMQNQNKKNYFSGKVNEKFLRQMSRTLLEKYWTQNRYTEKRAFAKYRYDHQESEKKNFYKKLCSLLLFNHL